MLIGNYIELITSIATVISSAVLLFIAFTVHRYTKRKDKVNLLYQQWSYQQQINMIRITNDKSLEFFEKIVYGDDVEIDIDQSRRFHELFLVINRIHHLWLSKYYGVLNKKEFAFFASPTIKLIKRQEKLISYLLLERGYPPQFRDEFLDLMEKVDPPAFE
ncbi:MAG: hypothetical protein ACFB6R_16015 [Alphaproteobacteria bacterium]